MALWKCMNADCEEFRHRFAADCNRCPHCKLMRGFPVQVVHYLVPAEGPIKTGLGNRMVACDQTMKKLPKYASGMRSGVTCPACRASTIFAEDERDGVSNNVPLIEAVTAGCAQKL